MTGQLVAYIASAVAAAAIWAAFGVGARRLWDRTNGRQR